MRSHVRLDGGGGLMAPPLHCGIAGGSTRKALQLVRQVMSTEAMGWLF
jgi:hypothetical protein